MIIDIDNAAVKCMLAYLLEILAQQKQPSQTSAAQGFALSPPLRFSQCIHENVYDGAIGIFLLNNGNIVLSKDRQIKFVKRNLRWLNFSFEAFRAASCSGENTWDEKLL